MRTAEEGVIFSGGKEGVFFFFIRCSFWGDLQLPILEFESVGRINNPSYFTRFRKLKFDLFC
jgi:hypothetical protein